MYLKALDFIVVVLYLALMSVIGIYFSKRQTSGETYFLAGRGVSGILAGISILATLLSTISYLSIPGEMIRFGIGYFSSYLALILVVPVVTKVIIPYLMRLPVTSIYEYLEKRYGVQIRTLAAAIFIFTERLDLVQQGDFRVGAQHLVHVDHARIAPGQHVRFVRRRILLPRTPPGEPRDLGGTTYALLSPIRTGLKG